LLLLDDSAIAAPDLVGKTVRRVGEECLRLGLNPVLIGTGVAVKQNPEAGVLARRGQRITVRFARSADLLLVSDRGN